MMDVGRLSDALLGRFPQSDAEPWDRVGLSVGNPRERVSAVACALDATEASIRRAYELGANVLLTHHPVYLKAPDALTPASPDQAASAGAIWSAIRLGVSVISLHTNLDRSHEARLLLSEAMGGRPLGSLEWTGDPSRTGLGALCSCEPCTLNQLARRAAAAFATAPRVWGSPDKPVRRFAILGGSLGDFGENALSAQADAVVTGECGYHIAQDLCSRGLAVLLLGHDRSEESFCRILSDAAIACGVPSDSVHIIPGPAQWWTAL